MTDWPPNAATHYQFTGYIVLPCPPHPASCILLMPHTVADLCRDSNIDVAELARRCGLDEGRVTAIALGRWTPSPAERQKIAAVFRVAADQIASGHSTPIQHLYGHGPG
jgi:hypothetical protein